MWKELRSLIVFSLLILWLIIAQKGVLAQERTFLPLKLEFLDEYELTQESYQDVVIGGLSGITYSPEKDVYYAISDDRSQFSPARFFTLKINLEENGQLAQIKNEQKQ